MLKSGNDLLFSIREPSKLAHRISSEHFGRVYVSHAIRFVTTNIRLQSMYAWNRQCIALLLWDGASLEMAR